MYQPNPAHSTHDLVLIAALAHGDLPESDRLVAESQLASCHDCAELRRDLLTIADATHSVPAPLHRTRDFQLGEEQAGRLRRGSWLRNVLRPFAATRSAARPLAAAFTTLGVAGLLIASALPSLVGGAASLAQERGVTSTGVGAGMAGTAAPVFGAQVPAAQQPSPGTDESRAEALRSRLPSESDAAVKAGPADTTTGGVAIAGQGTPFIGDSAAAAGSPDQSHPASLLLIGSAALLAVGLVLFGLRFAGRRVR